MSVFNRILCPTDFSQPSRSALNLAISLAQEGAVEVLVAYVGPDIDDMAASGALPEHQVTQEHQEAMRDLCAFIEQQTPGNVSTQAIVRHGEVAPQILQLAQEQQADLIVLAAHSSEESHDGQGVESRPLGSVAQQILREAPCPVLVTNNRTRNRVRQPVGLEDLKRALAIAQLSDSL